MEERIQKIIARSGLCSRRAAEELIRQGKVKLNGQVVVELGTKVVAGEVKLTVNDKPLSKTEQKIYLLLNKPVGFVTTMKDTHDRPIVTSLLKGVRERVFPVGRLDFDTSGALIFTNDGELAQKIQHPKFEINKTYLATVKGQPSATALQRLRDGVMVEGRKTYPAQIKMVKDKGDSVIIEVVIHEGRKRQVRKMMTAIGHPVLALSRIAYGNLALGPLKSGSFRYLSKQDLQTIFQKNKQRNRRR